jgi:hypothetical protein
MARRAASFTKTEATRAVQSALAAGLDVDRVEFKPDGTIAVIAKQDVPAGPTPIHGS